MAQPCTPNASLEELSSFWAFLCISFLEKLPRQLRIAAAREDALPLRIGERQRPFFVSTEHSTFFSRKRIHKAVAALPASAVYGRRGGRGGALALRRICFFLFFEP